MSQHNGRSIFRKRILSMDKLGTNISTRSNPKNYMSGSTSNNLTWYGRGSNGRTRPHPNFFENIKSLSKIERSDIESKMGSQNFQRPKSQNLRDRRRRKKIGRKFRCSGRGEGKFWVRLGKGIAKSAIIWSTTKNSKPQILANQLFGSHKSNIVFVTGIIVMETRWSAVIYVRIDSTWAVWGLQMTRRPLLSHTSARNARPNRRPPRKIRISRPHLKDNFKISRETQSIPPGTLKSIFKTSNSIAKMYFPTQNPERLYKIQKSKNIGPKIANPRPKMVIPLITFQNWNNFLNQSYKKSFSKMSKISTFKGDLKSKTWRFKMWHNKMCWRDFFLRRKSRPTQLKII